jgi:hypothetical protein
MRTLLLMLSLACVPVWSATVFRSVDARGHVTFSDEPVAQAVSVEHIVLPEHRQQRSALDEQRLLAMRETTARMAADRREREQARASARERALASAPQVVYYEMPRYPVVGRRLGHRPWRPPGSHRPSYPQSRPGPVPTPYQLAHHRQGTAHKLLAGSTRSSATSPRMDFRPFAAYRAPAWLSLK